MSVHDWVVLGIAALLIASSIVIYALGRRNSQLPQESQNPELEQTIQRVGFWLKLVGAATVALLGIENIMGWRF